MVLATIETERLVLRPLRVEDADALHEAFSDPNTMQYWSSGPHRSATETREYVAVNAKSGDFPTWAITRRGDDCAIGWVVAIPRRPQVSEIGYILTRKHWGSGIAREAVGGILDHLFDTENHRRVCADTDPDNAHSIALLEKLGFQREGYLREEWETHLGVRDSVMWGMLAHEWRGRD